MNVFDKNIMLVSSMSKSEKRGFKLFCGSSQSDKGFLLLFDLIDENQTLTSDEIGCKFKKGSAKNVDSASRYLYGLLMKFLTLEQSGKSITTLIYHHVERSKILFERKLYEDAFEELKSGKRLAEEYESDLMLLLLWRTELSFHEKLDFGQMKEQDLAQVQMHQLEWIKRTRAIEQHKFLFNVLNHRLNIKGDITSKQKKEMLNDLVISEFNLMSNSKIKGFEAEKLHLLFQSTYYLETGNHKAAVRFFHELIALFEHNKHLMLTPPTHYINALEGIINTLLQAGLYSEVEPFLERARDLKQEELSSDLVVYINWLEYTTRLTSMIHLGQFSQVSELDQSYTEILFDRINQLQPNDQIQLLIVRTTYFLFTNQLAQARKQISVAVNKNKLYQKQPLFRYMRMMLVLIRAIEGDVDYVVNEVKSLKYQGRNESDHELEKVFLDFVREYPLPIYRKSREQLMKKYMGKIARIREERFVVKLLTFFDFTLVIESQLMGVPVEVIIQQRQREE